MKKRIQTTVAILGLLMVSGCAGSAADQSAPVVEPIVDEEPAGELQPEAPEVQEEEAAQESAPMDSKDLYERFLNNEESAVYTLSGQDPSSYNMCECLTENSAYTLDEIVNGIIEYNTDIPLTALDNEHSYIDCGMDGAEELLVMLPIKMGEGEQFDVYMIIKDYDGELRIVYNTEGWSRSWVEITPTGFILNQGSNGAASSVSQFSFVNADGVWKNWYSVNMDYDVIDEFYTYDSVSDYKILDFSSVDHGNMAIESYKIYDDPASPEWFYTFYFLDDEWNPVDDPSLYEDSNPIKKVFTDSGCKVYAPDEIQKTLDSRKQEIGLTDAIIADSM